MTSDLGGQGVATDRLASAIAREPPLRQDNVMTGADFESAASADRTQLADALAGVAGGSAGALEEVYSRTSAKLFAICLRILGDRGDAEDILQDIYLNLDRRAASFDPERGSPVAWLATIARNRAIDRVRARAARPHVTIDQAGEIADPSPDAATLLEAVQDAARLEACLDELEARHAGAIRSAFFDGVSYPELAAQSAVPLGTMKSWIRRSLLRLRECLSA